MEKFTFSYVKNNVNSEYIWSKISKSALQLLTLDAIGKYANNFDILFFFGKYNYTEYEISIYMEDLKIEFR